MLEIEQVVDVLKDGEWHELDEIGEKCELSEAKVESIIKFLQNMASLKLTVVVRK